MGYEVVLQPNGYLALWSTITDDYTDFNKSRTEIFSLLKSFGFRFNEALQIFLRAYEEVYKSEWDRNLRFISQTRGIEKANYIEEQDTLMSPRVDFSLGEFGLYKNSKLLTVFLAFSDFKHNYKELTLNASRSDIFELRDKNHKTLMVIIDSVTYIANDWIY